MGIGRDKHCPFCHVDYGPSVRVVLPFEGFAGAQIRKIV